MAAAGDVYLLGAGFARAITGAMPLLQDLAQRVEQGLDADRALPPEVRVMMRENFAHALSYLEQAKPWVTEADNLRHRALFLDISNAIARDLEATVAENQGALRERTPRWLHELIRRWHAERCVVLTLNYDTLIETVAAGLDIEGHGPIYARQLYPPLLTDAGLRSGGTRPERGGKSFRLLKLHGSTNWYYSGRAAAYGEPIYYVPPFHAPDGDDSERRDHEERRRAVADKYPFLVPPIYDKSPLLTHETIRALWFEAGEALRHAGRLVCMGYSLPESDLTMKHFLRTSCREGLRIELVNQSDEARKNFARLFGDHRVAIESCARGPRCIADYVTARWPGPRAA